MEYRRMKYFLKAAETKNFTKAAGELFISHQALIKQIALLEEEMGGRLFERTTRRVRLTELGEAAYQRLGRIDRQLEKALAELKEFSRSEGRTVRFGIFSAIPKELFSLLIDETLAAYPDIILEPVMSEYVDARLSLLEGRTDVCLTNTHQEEQWDGFRKIPLVTMGAKVAVSLYHPWAARDSISVEDMEQEAFIKLDIDRAAEVYNEARRKQKRLYYRAPAEEAFFENIPCSRRINVPNFDSLLATLERGRGFAVIPDEFMQRNYFKVKFFDVPYQDFLFQTAFLYPIGTEDESIKNMVRVIGGLDVKALLEL